MSRGRRIGYRCTPKIKTICPNGHQLTEDNVIIKHVCATCNREGTQRWRDKRDAIKH